MESPFTEIGKSMKEMYLWGKIGGESGHVNIEMPIAYSSGVIE